MTARVKVIICDDSDVLTQFFLSPMEKDRPSYTNNVRLSNAIEDLLGNKFELEEDESNA